ncbi:hypothetical protein E4T56_gene12612 [Termitomyces sp. T112]|nr:hypothetical protein E4T56_gene12612 [Termitomyces sp. T112]
MSGRTPFTNDEDSLLVKYIATYNPSNKGRSGNTLYQTLCKDADNKWKWSRTHPWQSWRDRYCKNQREFDIKIKKYQIKHDILAVDENMVEKSSEERPVGLSKRKRENDTEEKCARAKHDLKQSQIPASETEEPIVLDKGKGKVVTNHSKDDLTQITQEESAALNVAHIDTVNQKLANADELSLPASLRTTPTSSPSLNADAKGPLSHNSRNVFQKSSATESQRNLSITYQISDHTVPADTQPVASSSKVQISPELNVPFKAQGIKKSRRLKPVAKDDVFFDSSPPTSSPLNSRNAIRPKNRNPKLVQGPFGTRFASRRRNGGNDSSENEKETPVWPPTRKKNNFQGKGKAVEAMSNNMVTSTLPRDVENAVLPAARQETHPVSEHQPRKMSASSINGPDNGQEANILLTSSQTQQGRLKYTVHHGSLHEAKETTDQHSTSQISSSLSHDALDSVPAAKTEACTGREREVVKLPLPRHFWTPNNPSRSSDETIIRRHSMGNLREVQSSAVRRLDLRAELAKRRFAASSPFTHSRVYSVATTVSYQPSPGSSNGRINLMDTDNIQRRRSSISIADEDRERIEFLGLNAAIEGIAQDSGYPVEQVWRVYDHYRSVKRTETWFRLYRNNSARLQEVTHEQMMENGMGALPIVDEHRTPRSSPLERDQRSEPSTEPVIGTRASPLKAHDKRLKIKPLPPDPRRSPSEYSPPHETRAGEYNRLVGQGRIVEAMFREHRRASGGGSVFPRLRSSPADWKTLHQSSPTSDVETHGDGIEDEDDVVDQLLDESNSSEATDWKSLQEEEETLFLSARVEIVDELRAIEQKTNPDYMLRWVAARLGEMEDEFRQLPSSS